MARSSPRRGLQIMRTQSTRKATGALSSPEMYIRLTSLEMERARRVMERDRLLERVRILEERIGKIAQEQGEMRSRISNQEQQQFPPLHLDSAPSQSRVHDSQSGFTY